MLRCAQHDIYNDAMNGNDDKPKKRKRRWGRYSLRTFLLLLTGFGIWLGLLVQRVNKQKEAVQWVRDLGGDVAYDFQFGEGDRYANHNADPPGPDWLRELIGIGYFADVVIVYGWGGRFEAIEPLRELPHLRWLSLDFNRVSDLSPIRELTQLRGLSLDKTPVSDLSPIAELTQLQQLDLRAAQVSDLTPLRDMKQLQQLVLTNSPVSDVEPLGALLKLKHLDLRGTSVSDLSPLHRLRQVRIDLVENRQVIVPEELKDHVNRSPYVPTEQLFLRMDSFEGPRENRSIVP